MKRTGFKNKPKKPLSRRKGTLRRKPLKNVRKRKESGNKRKLPSIKRMRNKCDALLTPIIIKRHPHCLLCGKLSQVAHHHVHKSKSSRLRYELNNLIPLCNSCHLKLHVNESYWASCIVQIKGLEWFADLQRKKEEIVKTDVHFYIENHERLNAILE